MAPNNRNGFTIVELVIVIAVMAILAAVLIPTFSDVVEKADKSAALQEARNNFANYMADHAQQPNINLIIEGKSYFFAVVNGQMLTGDANYYGTLEAAMAAFTGGTVAVAQADSAGVAVVTVTPAQ